MNSENKKEAMDFGLSETLRPVGASSLRCAKRGREGENKKEALDFGLSETLRPVRIYVNATSVDLVSFSAEQRNTNDDPIDIDVNYIAKDDKYIHRAGASASAPGFSSEYEYSRTGNTGGNGYDNDASHTVSSSVGPPVLSGKVEGKFDAQSKQIKESNVAISTGFNIAFFFGFHLSVDWRGLEIKPKIISSEQNSSTSTGSNSSTPSGSNVNGTSSRYQNN